jgi:hypothetical protein
MWSVESDGSNTNGSCAELGDEKELNLTHMTRVEEGPSTIDIDSIIASKNVLNRKIIELLGNMAMSKNKELESQQRARPSTISLRENEVLLNLFYDSDEMHKIDDSSIFFA